MDTPGFPVLPPVNKHSYRTRIRKATHFLKKRWWKLRTRKRVTKLLGRQFVRTRELIEIDLTYAVTCVVMIAIVRADKHPMVSS